MRRHIAFEGIENFRDFGGYATACGRGLRPGRLFRSGDHSRATEADLAALKALGISAIVDLRRPDERERFPSRRWAGFGAAVIDSDAEQEHTVEWLEFLRGTDLSIEAFRRYMLDYYRAAPTDPRYVDLYSRYFHAVADSEGAVLVHCAAGKDRTGLICALTQHLAGVHDDDIVADYLLTNDPARIAARSEVVGQLILEATGRTPSERALAYAISVDAEYLAEAFAAMRDRFGSVDAYLEQGLGLDARLRERLHARLLG
ncbi:MAG TPA: tyrosine-protein phosphatase [Phenylobacterium sp.]|jgi:protein tyrosine/serine phosphatase|nr:tyrosine-protein phosphatase [Phenylobacterium sp.]